MSEEGLTIEEAARRLAVTTQYIYRLVKRKKLSWVEPPRAGRKGEGGRISAEAVEVLRIEKINHHRQQLAELEKERTE